jgi:hypothetical protein
MDWLGGRRVILRGEVQPFDVGSTYRFDAAICCGEFGVSFESHETKGRIARWNGILPTPHSIPPASTSPASHVLFAVDPHRRGSREA